jgi:hypothetical protein
VFVEDPGTDGTEGGDSIAKTGLVDMFVLVNKKDHVRNSLLDCIKLILNYARNWCLLKLSRFDCFNSF